MDPRGAGTGRVRFVLDASAFVRALAHDEGDPEHDLLVRAFTGTPVVPGHWFIEVVQAATSGVRSRRWSLAWARAMISTARRISVTTLLNADGAEELLDVALASRLTAQDAAYLQLARDLGVPLATADADLRAAAERIGVACL